VKNCTPRSEASSIAERASAVAISVFDGTTSVSTADPPTPARSMSVTSAPSWAPAIAASYPPGPPPRTPIRCFRSNS
jgi:hypothetical protein